MYESSVELVEFYATDRALVAREFSRASFRVPVVGRDGFYLKMGTRCLPLADISNGGISLLSAQESALAVGVILRDCALCVEDEQFNGLEGRVVHHSLNSEGRTISGIQWLDLHPTVVQRFKVTLERLRRDLFRTN